MNIFLNQIFFQEPKNTLERLHNSLEFLKIKTNKTEKDGLLNQIFGPRQEFKHVERSSR